MSWMNDKHSLVALREYGKDEDSTQALIKKHEAIEFEIEGYGAKIGELCTESQSLVEGGHFDSKVIAEKEVRLIMEETQFFTPHAPLKFLSLSCSD